MRHVVMVAIAIIFAIAIKLIKQHREKILIGGIVVLCLVNGAYTYTRAESILPTRHPYNQTFYDPEYIKTQEFPDGFLRLFLKGKTVYVKNDPMTNAEAVAAGKYWQFCQSHYYNPVHYLESVNADVIPDKALNDSTISDERKSDFEALGFLNDMLRNTMMYSEQNDETGNFLYFLYWYRDETDPAKVYINTDGINGSDELVMLWQLQDGSPDTEDLFIMSRDYYENSIK